MQLIVGTKAHAAPALEHFPERLCRLPRSFTVHAEAGLGRPFDFTGWSWGSLGMLSPQQGNGYDCAIFCPILLARSLAHRVSLRSGHGGWSNLELDRHRDLVTRELLTGRVLSSSK